MFVCVTNKVQCSRYGARLQHSYIACGWLWPKSSCVHQMESSTSPLNHLTVSTYQSLASRYHKICNPMATSSLTWMPYRMHSLPKVRATEGSTPDTVCSSDGSGGCLAKSCLSYATSWEKADRPHWCNSQRFPCFPVKWPEINHPPTFIRI